MVYIDSATEPARTGCVESENIHAASEKLVKAISEKRPGFVTRIAVPAEQASFAEGAAWLRRVAAKLANQGKFTKNYKSAALRPTTPAEQSRLCTDRRAVLAELAIGDLLFAADPDTSLQPLVSHKPEPGADAVFQGVKFEIKSAGQICSDWHGCLYNGRRRDDMNVMINCIHHGKYIADGGFGGYICTYLYVHNDAPSELDVYFFPAEHVSKLSVQPGRLAGGSAQDYYSIRLPFPDALHAQGLESRIAALRTLH